MQIEPLESRIAPAVFLVNSLLDGLPVKDGNLTLREAVIAATTNVAAGDAAAGEALADSIVFVPSLAGGTIQLNSELVIAAGGQLSVTGPGTSDGSIVLRAGANSRVLHILDPVDAVLLSHLTITNGNPNDGDGGGGILNDGGSLFLDDVLITGNTAANEAGGGIGSRSSDAKLSIVHSRIVENSADVGGGVDADGLLTIHDTTISSNSAVEGGGIDNHGTATITTSRIIGNHGTDGDNGAGISNEATMILQETIVSGNVGLGSGYSGAGIYSNGTLTILNSTISGNLSQGRGGGIHFDGGTLTIVNSTIANNTSLGTGGGGGIRVETPDALSITNSTIVGNVDATSGGTGAGGILNTGGGAPLLANTIVAGNFAATGTSADLRGAFSAGSANNFIGVGDGSGILNNVNGNQVGTSGAPLDPKLGPLQDNGGHTFTMSPLKGSPVIDAGLNDAAIKAAGVPLVSDQRGPGFTRIIDGTGAGGGTVDIGAVEFAPVPNVAGVTSFTFIETGGELVNVALKGGGTFDLVLNTASDTISRLDIHGATLSSTLAIKVLTPGATVSLAGLHADGAMKGISLGKGVQLTGTIGIDGALTSLALDTTAGGSFIRTGGTAKQTLNVTVNGDFSATLDTTSAVGKLKLPKFNFNGDIRAASIGDITALSFAGFTSDDAFNLGDNTKRDLIATDGPIGKLTTGVQLVRYDILAGPGSRGTLGGISVTNFGFVFGIEGTSVTAAQIGAISVKVAAPDGGTLPVRGIRDSSFTATNGGIAGVAVSLSSTAPDGSGSFGILNSSFTAAAGIGNVTITSKDPAVGTITDSSFIAGTKTLATWANLATARLQLAALKNSSIGSIAVTGAIAGSKFIAAGNIGAITAPGSFSSSLVLAGASLGADGALGGIDEDADIYVRPVSIGALTLKQPVASSISAGIDPGGDSVFGNFNDVAATAGLVVGGSKIGAVKITASFNFNPANPGMSHGFAIQAATIAKITINGQNAALGANGVSLDTDASGADTFNDIVIHLL